MCDEKMGSCGADGGSSCGGHDGCHHHGCGHKSLLWWLIALAIGAIVFCAGVKVGEMKAFYGGWGYSQGYPSMMNGWGYGMMRGWNGAVPLNQAATTSQK